LIVATMNAGAYPFTLPCRYVEAKRRSGGPTFLFLFQADVGQRVLIERSVKSHWAEHYDAKCKPGG
jgi:hypothetical protein